MREFEPGTGIPAENMPHFFDRVWRARKADRQGAGLGLPIVKRIVEAPRSHFESKAAPAHSGSVSNGSIAHREVVTPPPLRPPPLRLMSMPVVHIRHVHMVMGQARVPVRMAMGLRRRHALRTVRVLVMRIVQMEVGVLEPFMGMQMPMSRPH